MWNNISNIAAIIKNKMVRTNLNDLDLVPLAARDENYDGNYREAAILPKDLVAAADAQNTGYYTVNFTSTYVVDVTTPKGVIEILLDSGDTDPLPAFGSAIPLVIANAAMDFSNSDAVYQQITPYYLPVGDDTFIPYVLPTGFLPTGAQLAILNANPSPAGLNDQFKGRFYVYYELYNF